MHLYNNGGNLPKGYVMQMLEASISMHRALPNVLQLSRRKANSTTGEPNNELFTGRLTIVGDTHGQYEDFAQIFEIAELGDYPTEDNQFVINGDMVDRGPKAVEILLVLLFAKLLSPNSVHILRGNHESRYLTQSFGFQKEVLRKYDYLVLDKFLEFFDTLPIAAVVENSVFVVHGGIGPLSMKMSIDDINKVDRFVNSFTSGGVVYEMLWSDPTDQREGITSSARAGTGAAQFGADVTRAFLARNKLDEVQQEGYKIMHDGKCISVFSAPNYCRHMTNKGAVVRYSKPDSTDPEFVQFASARSVNRATAARTRSLDYSRW